MYKSIDELNKINDKLYKNFDKILKSYKYNIDYSDSEDCNTDFKNLIDSTKELEVKYIKYSNVSTLIYSYDDYILDDFIEFFKVKIQKKEKEKCIQKKSVDIFFKIISHIELSAIQKRNLYNSQQTLIDKLNEDISVASKENKNLKNSHGELKKKYENIMISFVSILGIFASIIFAVFGGFKQLEGLGNNLHHIAIYKMLMYIGCTGIVITSIVFISFYAVSKLTGLKLHSCGCDSKCECSVYKKYPVLMMTYHFLISMISTGFIILLLRHYYDFGLTNKTFVGVMLIVMFFILAILPVLIFLYQKFLKIKK